MATWRELIKDEMKNHKDSVEFIVGSTLKIEDWGTEFDEDYGCTEGVPFTLWTEDRVYFPVCYDGAESVGSVPRHPCDEITAHIGG